MLITKPKRTYGTNHSQTKALHDYATPKPALDANLGRIFYKSIR